MRFQRQPLHFLGSHRWIPIAALAFLPLVVEANPVILDPSSLLAFAVVAFWAFVVEAGIVALLLTLCGLQPLRVFVIYFLIKLTVFLFVFQPLLQRSWSIPLLEVLVVCFNGLVIKILAGMAGLQTDDYRKVSWLCAVIISLLGNGASFFVGVIASRKPWEME